MNELPGFWDRQGANIASRCKKMCGKNLFLKSKKRFWREINAFFDTDLSEIDLGNVDIWKQRLRPHAVVGYGHGTLIVRSVPRVGILIVRHIPRVGNLTWPPSWIMKRAWKSTLFPWPFPPQIVRERP